MFAIILFIVCGLVWGQPSISAALTAEEVLLLKQNGVSEKTIQMMLESEKRAQLPRDTASQPGMGVSTITRPDGRKAIVYSTGRADPDARDAEERLKEERAWEMLRYLIIDTRSTEN